MRPRAGMEVPRTEAQFLQHLAYSPYQPVLSIIHKIYTLLYNTPSIWSNVY